MLDIKFVRDNLELVRRGLAGRGESPDLSEFIRCDAERRRLLIEVERLKQERNALSRAVAERKRRGEEAADLVAQVRGNEPALKELEAHLAKIEERQREIALTIPNLPHPSVPAGRSSQDNVEVRRWGTPRAHAFGPRPHWEIGEALGILDFERASKVAQSRFAFLVGPGARLERALINFMLDLHTREQGYTEIFPPLLVNADTMTGTGNLPKFGEEAFKTLDESLYMIPTAEVPVTNLYRGELLPPGSLPRKYTAYTPCFRREAGAAGKDTRGLIRQHQFNKVELVWFTEPGQSYDALEQLVRDAEEVLRRLEIPHRTVVLCAAEMGFAAAKTYDIEVWLPGAGDGGYREISSCSNCADFQARRAGIRYRPGPKAGPEFVHTLNGSGVAVGRAWIAILENFQEADGSVAIPDALRPYMDGLARIPTP
jgi:seryl-tRNA synthetase